jgi:hypothetical protein
LRSGPFEGPAIVIPPALPEDTYFEEAFFGEEAEDEKPYSALEKMKRDGEAFTAIKTLLEALLDANKALPQGAVAWSEIEDLQTALAMKQNKPEQVQESQGGQ